MSLLRFIILLVLALLPAGAKLAAETLNLDLATALATTLEKNPLLVYHQLGVAIANNNLDSARSIYDHNLNAFVSLGHQGWQREDLGGPRYSLDQANSLSLQKLHSHGGSSSLGFSTGSFSQNYYEGLDRFENYRAAFFLRHDLPVLRNAGREITNLGISSAKISQENSEEFYQNMRSQMLYQVFRDYFFRYRIARNLEVARTIRESTKEMFLSTKEQVAMRRLPLTDHKATEARILAQDSQIRSLLNDERRAEYQLLYSIFNDARPQEIAGIVLPNAPLSEVDKLKAPPLAESIERLYQVDMSMVGLLNQKRQLDLEHTRAVDSLKPDLRLGLELALDGDSTRSHSGAFGDLSSDNYRIMATANFSFPWQNTQAISNLARVKNSQLQLDIQINERKAQIRKSLQELYDSLETTRLLRENSRRLVSLARENLADEVERLRAEKSTVINTLSYQNDLLYAELSLLDSELNYVLQLGELLYQRREVEQLAGAAVAGN